MGRDSKNAYQQIMKMLNEALFVLDAIYKMDTAILRQFISIESCAFYVFWLFLSYFATIPRAARSARIYLFVGIGISIILEKQLISVIPIDFDSNGMHVTIRR